MNEKDIIEFVSGLPETFVQTAGPGDGSPELAWGDTFIFYAPEGRVPTDGRLPYATIVTKDYEGFDTESDLNRPGVFRLNVAVGRAEFERLVGYPPAAHREHRAEHDYTVINRIIPNPNYATQGWIAILNPAGDEETVERVRGLLRGAHERAAKRHRPRGPRQM
ncbi:DUF6194 family protein [Nonomuraea candida]|uniref:DUF6194 family protein n=1 Tax=Nonomuraea candida TaxID=359159 RepID=UPI0005BD7D44|nr:DUF6194 family protein [Nonomuraea candida]